MEKSSDAVIEIPNPKKSRKQSKKSAASKDALMKVPRVMEPRKSQAFRRLGIRQGDVARAPEITSILSEAVGGIAKIIPAMRFSTNPAVTRFFSVYDSVPKGDRESLPLEAIALKADVDLAELLGAAILAFRKSQAQRSAIIAFGRHPEVLQQTIECALKPGGDRDRALLHSAVGFTPTPKGSTLNVNINQNDFAETDKIPDKGGDDGDDDADVNLVFPSVTAAQENWQPMRRNLLAEKN